MQKSSQNQTQASTKESVTETAYRVFARLNKTERLTAFKKRFYTAAL